MQIEIYAQSHSSRTGSEISKESTTSKAPIIPIIVWLHHQVGQVEKAQSKEACWMVQRAPGRLDNPSHSGLCQAVAVTGVTLLSLTLVGFLGLSFVPAPGYPFTICCISDNILSCPTIHQNQRQQQNAIRSSRASLPVLRVMPKGCAV